MTKVHGKRYAYKFDFVGLAQAMQPSTADSHHSYKYQSELFLPTYHHPQAKLNLVTAHAPPHTSGLLGPTNHYWPTPPGHSVYPGIANHAMTSHAGQLASHLTPYYV